MANSARLVVTGAGGFIGSRLVEVALERGWRVTAVLRDPLRLSHLECADLAIVRWAAGDTIANSNIFEGAEALCHLAAFIPPDLADFRYAEECFRVNALATLELARQVSQAKVGRFILLSGGLIYSPSEKPASEDAPTYPSGRATYYLASKLNAELFLQYFSLVSGLHITILRAASVYGKGMRHGSMMMEFIKRASEGSDIEVFNGGLYAVDLVHVDDVVDATLSAVGCRVDGILNIGSGVLRSSLEIANIVVQTVKGTPGCIKIHPIDDANAATVYPALDIAKARALINFDPMNLEEGLQRWLT
jgi:UDP-glucose 4-epimerase